MYSRIPMPHIEWKQDDMKYSVSFFPLVGAVIGALTAFWMRLFTEVFRNILPEGFEGTSGWNCQAVFYFVKILIALLLPILITGGIHLDGFMDTSDALHSWRGREEKLRILSDSHVGAFAVIRLLVFTGLYLAAVLLLCLDDSTMRIWCFSFFFARTLSGLSVVRFKNAKGEGTLYTFSSASDAGRGRTVNTAALAAEGLAAAALMLWQNPVAGAVTVVIGMLSFIHYRQKAYQAFGGITGDVAGWFLCRCELFMAMGLAVCAAAA